MTKKTYNIIENEPLSVNEPVAVYRTTSEITSSGERNPNVPFHGAKTIETLEDTHLISLIEKGLKTKSVSRSEVMKALEK